MKKPLLLLALGIASLACGRSPATSELDFRAASTSYAGLTWKVGQDTIRVCYSDSSNSDRHRDDVEYSILAWIEPMRDLADEELATNVELVGPRDQCDVSVSVGNYSPAYTRMGNRPQVYINYSGWFGSKTVTLHEFGHAFGLLDTYRGSGGSCQSGQPDSVMCRASYDDLQDDDKEGIQYVYDRVRRGLVAKIPNNLTKKVY